MTLTGTVKYLPFAQGSKSESLRPYILLGKGSRILLYKKSDNPFENNFFASFEGEKVRVSGEIVNGTLEADSVELLGSENTDETLKTSEAENQKSFEKGTEEAQK